MKILLDFPWVRNSSHLGWRKNNLFTELQKLFNQQVSGDDFSHLTLRTHRSVFGQTFDRILLKNLCLFYSWQLPHFWYASQMLSVVVSSNSKLCFFNSVRAFVSLFSPFLKCGLENLSSQQTEAIIWLNRFSPFSRTKTWVACCPSTKIIVLYLAQFLLVVD